jgi:hypothetical protein
MRQASWQHSMTQTSKKYCVVMLEDIDAILETIRIEEPPIDDEI